MVVIMKMPDVGVNDVEITEILVKVGDDVKVDQSLIIVESDKSSVEVPSLFSGIVKSILIGVGDKISIGSSIMMFELESKISEISFKKNNNNITGNKLSIYSCNQELKKTLDCNVNVDIDDNHYYSAYYAAPLVYRMARELGVDLSVVKGSGCKGRILRKDIQNYIKDVLSSIYSSSSSNSENLFSSINNKNNNNNLLSFSTTIDYRQFGDVQEVELGRIKKISGINLHRNWIMIPHVTQFDEVDITELEEFRKQQNISFKKNSMDVKVSLLIFIIKAVSKALERWPRFNSSLSSDGKMLIIKKFINIGIAVDTTYGLYVPVFRNVNNKGIIDLAHEFAGIFKKINDGSKFTISDLQGGSFTVSSLGSIGGTYFTPIVNAPEVAILGISKSSIKSVWNGKEFIPKLMLPLSLSYDHRVIDGADGARFMSFINKLLSDIRYLIM